MKNRVNISVADLITSHLVELVHVDSRCCYQLFHNLQVAVPEQIQIAILVKDHIEWWSLTCPHESNPPTITKRQTKIILTRRPTWEQSSRQTPSSWLLFLGSQGGPQSRLCDLSIVIVECIIVISSSVAFGNLYRQQQQGGWRRTWGRFASTNSGNLADFIFHDARGFFV